MLDLADIQGNIVRPYGRFGFPHTRHLFFHITGADAGRRFVEAVRGRVTTAKPWPRATGSGGETVTAKPAITMNVGFSWEGLRALDLPTTTLRLLPDEFIDGMACRAEILGDVGDNAPERWDPVWRDHVAGDRPSVHIWVSLNTAAAPDGSPLPVLDEWTVWLESLCAEGVTLRAGHGGDGAGRWQDSRALMAPGPDGAMQAVPKEHFGFTDGISDPVFQGQFDPEAEALAVRGTGKLGDGRWSALAAGEFLLGQVDEAQEFPVATQPAGFARNGTFMVYRKLRQDVPAFEKSMERQAALWMRITGCTDPVEAGEVVRAKVVGRWRNGLPLAVAPTWAEYQELVAEEQACLTLSLKVPRDSAEERRLAAYRLKLVDIRYADDPDGRACPLGAHVRRANPRDMLDPHVPRNAAADPAPGAIRAASTLTNRRRLIRRGLPYEEGGEVGIIFMGLCASLFRQFEFIQQQWMSYGLDFEAGNDGCPLVGNRARPEGAPPDKHVVPAGPANAEPFVASGLPQFVSTRGGEYFFVPGMGALRQIAMGTVDPT